jgi:hypothetical protein
MPSLLRLAALAAALSFIAEPALAYIGPGAGLSVISAFWALLTAVVSSLLFLVLWPVRNRLRRRKAARDDAEAKPPVEALARPQAKLRHGAAQGHRR